MEYGFLPEVKLMKFNFCQKPISEINVGENIFSNPSMVNKVQNIESNRYSGNIFQLKCKGQMFTVKCSNEQSFFAVKKEIREYCRKKYSRMNIEIFEKNIELIDVNRLKKGDMLIIPRNSMKYEIKSIDTSQFISSNSNYLRKKLPDHLTLTKELFRIFGLYLAEGNIIFTSDKRYKKKCSGISFTINSTEIDLCRELVSSGKRIFKLIPKIVNLPERHGRRINFYSTQLGEFFFSLFNTGSLNKKIHPYLMHAPTKFLNDLIFAWLEGDGWVNYKGSHKGTIIGNTISLQLATQIYTILINQGKLPTIHIAAHKDQNRKKARQMGFHLRHPLYSITLLKNLEMCHRKQNDLVIFTPISEIKSKYYSGQVLNLRVEGNNVYQANFFLIPGFE